MLNPVSPPSVSLNLEVVSGDSTHINCQGRNKGFTNVQHEKEESKMSARILV